MPGYSPRSRRPKGTRHGSWQGASFDGQAGSGLFRRPRRVLPSLQTLRGSAPHPWRLPWAGTRPAPAGAVTTSRDAAGRDSRGNQGLTNSKFKDPRRGFHRKRRLDGGRVAEGFWGVKLQRAWHLFRTPPSRHERKNQKASCFALILLTPFILTSFTDLRRFRC
jgi:hypothetical protein